MERKTNQVKVNVTDQDIRLIKDAQKSAGYKSLSAYMLDSALFRSPSNLTAIAQSLGQLGLVCNELMDDETGSRLLSGGDARAAVSAIC